jgi:hypothetical protein
MTLPQNPKQFLKLFGGVFIILGILAFLGTDDIPIGFGEDLSNAPWYIVYYRALFRLVMGTIALSFAYSQNRNAKGIQKILTIILGIFLALATLGGLWMLIYYYAFHPNDLPPYHPVWSFKHDMRLVIINLGLSLCAYFALKNQNKSK